MGRVLEINPVEQASSYPVVTSFLASLKGARRETRPFNYWLLDNPLPDGYCDDIANLPFPPPEGAVFDGKRETNNALRVFFSPENQAKFQVCRRVVECFQDASVRKALETSTGTDLSDGHLRIEYCQDTEGFWLEPHTDINVKMFTMLVYLSKEPELTDAGTDIYDQDMNHVGRAPFAPNRGLMFIPGSDTWHGFAKRPLCGVRRSIIVNYVTDEWRDRDQLA